MSEWKCRNCGAGVRRFDLLCSACNVKNSASLDRARRRRLAADDLLTACVHARRFMTGLLVDVPDESILPETRDLLRRMDEAIAKARGEARAVESTSSSSQREHGASSTESTPKGQRAPEVKR